jgi:hypothetical protein
MLTRLHPDEFSDEQIEIMARAAHEAFFESMTSKGFQYGPEINTGLKTHPALVEYEELPEDFREANRATVRDIPHKLRLFGYRIQPNDDQGALSTFSDTELEQLAQLEHRRWMEQRLESGWTFGPKTDPARKVHASLIVWDELSEEEREKDREMIRCIPRVLAEAGFVIVTA